MESYSIILPNERAKTYHFIAVLILLINLLVAGALFFTTTERYLVYMSLFATVACSYVLCALFINRIRKRHYALPFAACFFILTITWFLCNLYLLALCMLCFSVMRIFTSRKFEVVFNGNGIGYPSFPKKTFRWGEVSNVLLKDGVLTIDLKNNTLLQAIISRQSAMEIIEAEFNGFCRKQLRDAEL